MSRYYQNKNSYVVSIPTAEGVSINVDPDHFVADVTGRVYNQIEPLTEVAERDVVAGNLVYTYSPVEYATLDPATGKIPASQDPTSTSGYSGFSGYSGISGYSGATTVDLSNVTADLFTLTNDPFGESAKLWIDATGSAALKLHRTAGSMTQVDVSAGPSTNREAYVKLIGWQTDIDDNDYEGVKLFAGQYGYGVSVITGGTGGDNLDLTLAGAGTGRVILSNVLRLSSIAEYADNTAAKAAGLVDGDVYRTVDALKVVHA